MQPARALPPLPWATSPPPPNPKPLPVILIATYMTTTQTGWKMKFQILADPCLIMLCAMRHLKTIRVWTGEGLHRPLVGTPVEKRVLVVSLGWTIGLGLNQRKPLCKKKRTGIHCTYSQNPTEDPTPEINCHNV